MRSFPLARACGYAAASDSGIPFRPSETAISTSSTPRVFRSLKTLSQNLAPLVCSIHRPRMSRLSSGRMPSEFSQARTSCSLYSFAFFVISGERREGLKQGLSDLEFQCSPCDLLPRDAERFLWEMGAA